MVLVDGLGIVDAAEELRDVKLRDTDQGLQDEEDVGDEAADAVGGCEVGSSMVDFVNFDDNQPADKGEGAEGVQNGVDVGA